MGFELPDDLSAEVARYAEEERLTPDEAVTRLVERGLRPRGATPARPPLGDGDPERSIGAFADMPDFVEIMEEIISRRAARYGFER